MWSRTVVGVGEDVQSRTKVCMTSVGYVLHLFTPHSLCYSIRANRIASSGGYARTKTHGQKVGFGVHVSVNCSLTEASQAQKKPVYSVGGVEYATMFHV